MQVILAGGGNKAKSLPVDTYFLTLLNEKPLLYIPVAMPPTTYTPEQCLQWLRSVFQPLGQDNIIMWTDLQGKTIDAQQFSGVYVGGGNTYLLSHHFQRSHILSVLTKAIVSGLPYYGGSAGAVILGKSILVSTDENTTNTTPAGMDVLQGYSVKCHYDTTQDEALNQFALEHGPVIAIPEDSGVLFDGETFVVLGTSPVIVFREGKRKSVPVGEKFSAEKST